MKIPQLRFNNYEGEWVAHTLEQVVPKGEKYGIVDGPFGSNLKTIHYRTKGIPIITSGYVTDGVFHAEEYLYVDEDKFEKEKRSSVKPGDIVMAKIGARCGASAILPKSHQVGILSGNALKITVDETRFVPNLIWQQLWNLYLTGQIEALKTVGAQPAISLASLKKFELILPSLPEQQQIASFLSAVDEKIQQLTRKKELLEQYKKGVMQQLFSGKLRFKDENGKPYPKWEEKRLGDVGDIVSGLTYSPVDVNVDGVLVLRSSNVQDRRLTFEDNVYVRVNAGEFNPVKENDILICVRNGSKNLIGKNALIGKENAGVAFGAFMTVYRSDFNSYLFHYFDTDSYKDEVHKNLGATINSINGSDLKKFKIPFPTKEEQQKIASFLTALDAKIESVAAQIAHTQTFKKGLLQQMFV